MISPAVRKAAALVAHAELHGVRCLGEYSGLAGRAAVYRVTTEDFTCTLTVSERMAKVVMSYVFGSRRKVILTMQRKSLAQLKEALRKEAYDD